jgi:hypothetical protein
MCLRGRSNLLDNSFKSFNVTDYIVYLIVGSVPERSIIGCDRLPARSRYGEGRGITPYKLIIIQLRLYIAGGQLW